MAGTIPRRGPACHPIPARAGVGLKPEHYGAVIEDTAGVAWFEVHAENYMGAGGPPHRMLERVRERHPLSIHGVGLSLGAAGPIDRAHLGRLKAVVERYRPGLVSEHLAWSAHGGAFLNDLLPLPYNAETLACVTDHVDAVQDALGRRILIENPSTYLRFAATDMTEIDFLTALAERTGCGLLLDVNNVQVCAANHGFDAAAYLDAFPLPLVGEIHLAGHAEFVESDGAVLRIDSHDRRIVPAVWSLYRRVIARGGPRPTLIEWDNDVPDWPTLADEARRADGVLAWIADDAVAVA